MGSDSMKKLLENILAILIILMAVGAILVMTFNAPADDDVGIPENTPVGPLVVRGTVYDAVQTPIADCPVIVNLYDVNMTLTQTLNDVTDVNGYYSVTFGINVWEVGGMITVIAQIDGQAEAHSVIGGNDPVITIDLQFDFCIPEFGVGVGGILTAMFAVGMIVLWLMRPKNGGKLPATNNNTESGF
jgi:preprotein translocase subunit SecG